jgi:hypothetical protein
MKDGQCVECPRGADCTAPGSTFDALLTGEGYWRENNQSTTFYRCLRTVHCAGGPARVDTGTPECGGHRRGPLCALCEPGYHGKSSDADCLPCATQQASWVGPVLIMMLFFLCLAVLFTMMWRSEGQRWVRLMLCVLMSFLVD